VFFSCAASTGVRLKRIFNVLAVTANSFYEHSRLLGLIAAAAAWKMGGHLHIGHFGMGI
jgi:hypothetical protein